MTGTDVRKKTTWMAKNLGGEEEYVGYAWGGAHPREGSVGTWAGPVFPPAAPCSVGGGGVSMAAWWPIRPKEKWSGCVLE